MRYDADDPLLTPRTLTACVKWRRDPAGSGLSVPFYFHDHLHYLVGYADEPAVNSAGHLVLTTTTPRAIGSIGVHSDESLTREGVWGGGSGGSATVVIPLYRGDTGTLVRADAQWLSPAWDPAKSAADQPISAYNLWITMDAWEVVPS